MTNSIILLESLFFYTFCFTSIVTLHPKYLVSVKENDFLIPKSVVRLEAEANRTMSTIEFYVLGSDLFLYPVSFRITSNPRFEVNNRWEMIGDEEGTQLLDIDAVYPLTKECCIEISFPVPTRKSVLETFDKEKREKILLEEPYSEADVRELIEKVTSIFTIEAVDNIEGNKMTLNMEDIKLDDNTFVKMSNLDLFRWSSGFIDTYVDLHSWKKSDNYSDTGYSFRIELNEFNTKEELDAYMDADDWVLEEYNYKGRNIKVARYGEDVYFKDWIGQYVGIMFECDGKYYTIKGRNSADPKEDLDVEKWIDNLCEEIIEFK